MVEQYIYSRSNSGFVNSRNETVKLGFGFMAVSPGLDSKTKQYLDVHCAKYTNEAVVDDKGQLVQILRKASLPNDQIVLQNNVSINVAGQRGFHVAHGFVLPVSGSEIAAPERWFSLPYYTTDPNFVEGGILLDSLDSLTGTFKPEPLAAVLSAYGLSLETFGQIVLACFETLDGRRQVMIPFDFTQPGARARQEQLLYWIYSFLPFQLRRQVGFDSVYSPGSGPRTVQIVFVSKAMLQSNGSQLSVKIGRETIALGANYVLNNGAVYNGGKPWKAPDGVFARWLNAAVNAACRSNLVTRSVNQIYDEFDKQLTAAGLQATREMQLYDALCWNALANGKGETLGDTHISVTVSPEEADNCRIVILARMQNSDAILSTLVDMLKQHHAPSKPNEIKMLVTALPGNAAKQIEYALGAFMASDLDLAAPQQQEETLSVYKALLPKDCYTLLFSWAFLTGAPKEAGRLWQTVGADASRLAAEKRRHIWYSNQLQQLVQISDLPGLILDTVDRLPYETAEGHTYLTKELVGIVRQKLIESIPRSSMLQIVGVADNLQRQWQRPDAEQCISILEALAQKYTAKPEEASLARLETVEQAFMPLSSCAKAKQIETGLYKSELEQLFSAKTPFEPTEQTFSQLLKACRKLDEFYDYNTASALKMQLYDRAFQALLAQPPVFLNADWLRSSLPDFSMSKIPLPDSLLAAQMLTAFCCGSVQSMAQWRKLQVQYDLSDKAYRMAFHALPQLYLNGALKKVQAGFIMLLIHCRPEHVDLILERTVRQGGSPLLLKVVQYAARYQRRIVIRRQESDDLIILLDNVCSPQLLDQTLQADGAPAFDAEVIKMLPDLVSSESITLEDAKRVEQQLWSHYESNAKNAGKRSIKKIVNKLENS